MPSVRAAYAPRSIVHPFRPADYGDSCALFYDQLYPRVAPGLVRTLVALAHGRPALELGLATGRVSLPLSAAGVAVSGIEASVPMLSQFLRRPDASSVRVVGGDFSALPFRGPFGLVFCLVGTLGLLPSRPLQARCMREVARVLEVGGSFLVEAFEDADAHGPITHHHPVLTLSGVQSYSVTFLPTPPHVLDALASAAGLTLETRWGNWSHTAYSHGRPHHVSVYRKTTVAA
jgi:SAM-dependent methyltransferase